jgi:hypothetical protein
MTVSSTLLLKMMRRKVKALMDIELEQPKEVRECQQWQLLFHIPSMGQVVVGKGGINTMFHIVADGERVLCLPDKMLEQIDLWISLASATTYSVLNAEKKTIKRNLSKAEAQAFQAKPGHYLAEVKDGKRKILAKRVKGLMGTSWKAVTKK